LCEATGCVLDVHVVTLEGGRRDFARGVGHFSVNPVRQVHSLIMPAGLSPWLLTSSIFADVQTVWVIDNARSVRGSADKLFLRYVSWDSCESDDYIMQFYIALLSVLIWNQHSDVKISRPKW
jgi:hypothetical protein